MVMCDTQPRGITYRSIAPELPPVPSLKWKHHWAQSSDADGEFAIPKCELDRNGHTSDGVSLHVVARCIRISFSGPGSTRVVAPAQRISSREFAPISGSSFSRLWFSVSLTLALCVGTTPMQQGSMYGGSFDNLHQDFDLLISRVFGGEPSWYRNVIAQQRAIGPSLWNTMTTGV